MSVFTSPLHWVFKQQHREIQVHNAVDFICSKLLEDPDVLDPNPQSVVCRRCQSLVELEGPDPYIEKWLAHKDKRLGQITQAR
jgi:hypothetical protein